nr:zinc ribbon domain-containing protein [Candidatus Freyarchaeota archaeon]
MSESYWAGEFDDVDLPENEVSDLIEEGLCNLGFMIVEKEEDEGKIVTRLKSGYVDSIGSVTFKKNKKHVSISISYEIIKPDVKKISLDEKTIESEVNKLEETWKNLSRMIDSLFSSGFIPAPEIKSVYCPHCGREIDWDSFFCKYCGHEVK